MKYLITGASSGIGKALAYEAAKNKNDLVLVARRKDKLEEIKTELSISYDISVEVLIADLTIEEEIKKVIKYIENNSIEVLINNAGFGSSGPFVEIDIENELNEIDLNVRALVQLTHVAAKIMAEKKYGTIVNISSIASYQPMVGNATYGATKAFVTSFTHAISQELNSYGVKVLLVCPGLTKSEFFSRSMWFDATSTESYLPKLLWKKPETVAKKIIKSVENGRSVLIPGLVNKIFAFVSSSLPGTFTKKITAVVAKGRRTR